MVRPQWESLNGLWQYAIRPKDAAAPPNYDGQILVPFAIESALSGVRENVGPANRLWYRRTFATPELPDGARLLLHFDAVDWETTVFLNGSEVGSHRGGYDRFTLDVTDSLHPGDTQELVVGVWDPSDQGYQPRGKQVLEPRGIWYTSVTGIWQSVWLEVVPRVSIRRLKVSPSVDTGQVTVDVSVTAHGDVVSAVPLQVVVLAGNAAIATGQTSGAVSGPLRVTLDVPEPRLWSPTDPYLYGLRVSLGDFDEVTSYFGMRKIEVRRDAGGFNRLFLNGEPLFHFGPLDQGWWPDGLYTAPTDSALKHDVLVTRQLGFNMCRKHVKVEPERWYYHCDRLGLMVWQDMPSGDRFIKRDEPDIERAEESAANFRREYQALIDQHDHHPSIVVWVPFNEGWGQFDTDQILAWTKQYDPSRLVDGPSGWADRGSGDLHDMHRYPGPAMPEPESVRAVVLGEFGGLGLPIEGHLWWNKRNWGYRTYKTTEELRQNYDALIQELRPLVERGLAAAVYTQTTDVEGEVNGLMTYDREIVKFDPEHLGQLHEPLYEAGGTPD
jgi:beta-galactosidase/beta-glucuronidase